MSILLYDVETTNLPQFKLPSDDPTQPHIVSIAGMLLDDDLEVLQEFDYVIKPEGWIVPPETAAIHGITTEIALATGIPVAEVIEKIKPLFEQADTIVCHNTGFDCRLIRILCKRNGMEDWTEPKVKHCTMLKSTSIVKAPRKDGKAGVKWPTLGECMKHFFNEDSIAGGAHNAKNDMSATYRLYRHLHSLGAFGAKKEVLELPL